MIKAILLFASILISTTLYSKNIPIYKDPEKSSEERVTELLLKMTLEEKIYQLNQYILG